MVPITGRASSFLEFLKLQSQSKLNPIHFLLFFLPQANLSCEVATISSSLAFLSSSVSMVNLSRLVATIFSSLAFLRRLHGQTEPFGSCIILQSCSSFFFCLHGQPELFASDHLLQSLSLQLIFITSLQSFESGQALSSHF